MPLQRSPYISAIQNMAFRYGKMAFIAGPRQVGKTTLALQIKEQFSQGMYYTWDDVDFKRQWSKEPKNLMPKKVGQKSLVIFDELHKAPKWKSTLKGLYDLDQGRASVLVTGSARLDVYRRGGDSLLGRYFLFRLHPFSVGELGEQALLNPDQIIVKLIGHQLAGSPHYDNLYEFGGFPDPLLKADRKFHNVWRQGRIERLVREDLIDLSRVRETGLMQTLMALLPDKVGSPLSVQSLTEDLQSNHPTVTRWLGWLEQIYYCYLISPYTKNVAKSLKKQPKLYLWDWSEIVDPGARFENLVAGHLLKAVHFWNDTGEGNFGLFYLRDKQKREVDFLIMRDKKPWMMVECKRSEDKPSGTLRTFAKVLHPKIAVQVVHNKGIHDSFDVGLGASGITISADQFFGLLP